MPSAAAMVPQQALRPRLQTRLQTDCRLHSGACSLASARAALHQDRRCCSRHPACPGQTQTPCRPLCLLTLRLLPFPLSPTLPSSLPCRGPLRSSGVQASAGCTTALLHRPPAAGRRCGKRVPSSSLAGKLATSLATLLACITLSTANETLHLSTLLSAAKLLLPPFVPLHPRPCTVAAAKRVLVLE